MIVVPPSSQIRKSNLQILGILGNLVATTKFVNSAKDYLLLSLYSHTYHLTLGKWICTTETGLCY